MAFDSVLPRGAVGWSTMCDCGVSKLYSLTVLCDLLSSIFKKIPTVITMRMALLLASRINVLPWPSCYSDRNQIEHICDAIVSNYLITRVRIL